MVLQRGPMVLTPHKKTLSSTFGKPDFVELTGALPKSWTLTTRHWKNFHIDRDNCNWQYKTTSIPKPRDVLCRLLQCGTWKTSNIGLYTRQNTSRWIIFQMLLKFPNRIQHIPSWAEFMHLDTSCHVSFWGQDRWSFHHVSAASSLDSDSSARPTVPRIWARSPAKRMEKPTKSWKILPPSGICNCKLVRVLLHVAQSLGRSAVGTYYPW